LFTDDGGTSFQVKLPIELANTVLPQYFRHSNYSSFQRQLNYFGFRKIGKSSKGEPCRYEHVDFVKDRPDSVVNIKRKTNHANSRKEKQNATQGNARAGAPAALKMNQSVTCKGYLQVQNYKSWTGERAGNLTIHCGYVDNNHSFVRRLEQTIFRLGE
jgi:hypothetical protein